MNNKIKHQKKTEKIHFVTKYGSYDGVSAAAHLSAGAEKCGVSVILSVLLSIDAGVMGRIGLVAKIGSNRESDKQMAENHPLLFLSSHSPRPSPPSTTKAGPYTVVASSPGCICAPVMGGCVTII